MKLLTFDVGNGIQAGLKVGTNVLALHGASDGQLPADLTSLLENDEFLPRARELAAIVQKGPEADIARHLWPLDEVTLHAPVPRPGKIVCLGLNYGDHAAESGAEIPSEPVVFCKATTSVIGPGEPIIRPAVSEKVDYEVEFAAVVGKPTKNVSVEEAMPQIAGYTIICDVSARDYQHEKPGGQWYLGKSFDTFCPMGPWVVTKDEIPDPHQLSLSCDVNGETRQSSNTSQLIFTIPEIVSYLSDVFTLEPGDVIATGTPSGVGAARTPPTFLQPNDTVRCRVDQIGQLENPVI